jgi:hypothetical protein
MSTLRNQINPSGVRSFISKEGLTHYVPPNHTYVAHESTDEALKLAKGWYAGVNSTSNGRPPYSIQYMLQQGDKDPRNYLGQGYTKTSQNGRAIQDAINDAMSDPNSPVYRNIDQYAKSLLQNGFKDAFDVQKRKRARNNQTNNGQGPQGNYNGPSEEVTPGLPEYQLPFYTGQAQASQQMKKQQFSDRAMENGGMEQVNSLAARPGWYTMDKRLGIPTASGGFNVPTYDPDTNRVIVKHHGQGFKTYMSNPNVNADSFDKIDD